MRRSRRLAGLLVVVVAIVGVDGLNHNLRIAQYHGQLPLVLHDYATKYEDLLLRWHAEQSKTPRNGPVKLPFEKFYRLPQTPTPGYQSLDTIPFMEAYLARSLPELAEQDQSFFGYRLSFALYVFVVLVAPCVVLLMLALRVWLLRSSWRRLSPHGSRPIADILAFWGFKVTGAAKLYLAGGTAGLGLLLVALLPPILVTVQVQNLPVIRGSLFLDPVGVPQLEDAYGAPLAEGSDTVPVLLLPVPDSLLTLLLLTALVSLLSAVCTATLLLMKESRASSPER